MNFYSYWKKWIEVKYVEERGFKPTTLRPEHSALPDCATPRNDGIN